MFVNLLYAIISSKRMELERIWKRQHSLLFKAAFLIVLLSLSIGLFSCFSEARPSRAETIVIAATPIQLNTLIYIADDQGFFNNNAVKIEFRDYETGVAAVDGLLRGEADIALTTEFVIVGNLFQKRHTVDIATIDKSVFFYIVARSDRDIKTGSDLKGKIIGVPSQTICEFYLGRTLNLCGIELKRVAMVDTKASDPGSTLASGNVDAVVTWEPHATNLKQQFGDRVTILPAQSNQPSYWSTVSTQAWVDNHKGLVKRFLQSLVKAEEYIVFNEDKAKAIIKKRLGYDDTYIAAFWPKNQFSVSLDQSLIFALEDEARWMINNNLTAEKQVPDFLNCIYEEGLKEVRPGSVNIIR